MDSPKEEALQNILKMANKALRKRISDKMRPPAPEAAAEADAPKEEEMGDEDWQLLAEEYGKEC